MKKFLALGLILVAFTAAASAQSVSGDDFRSHRMTNDFNNRQVGRGEGYRFRREGVRNRPERFGRGNRFEHRGFRQGFHHRRHHRFHRRFNHRHHGRRRVI